MLAKTKTNTVSYGKTQQGSYLLDKTGADETPEYKGGNPGTICKWGWVNFLSYNHIAEERQDIQVQPLKNVMERDSNSAPEA